MTNSDSWESIHTVGTSKITRERFRQITEEGYSLDHDAEHNQGELIRASQYYLIATRHALEMMDDPAALALMQNVWPWGSPPGEGDPVQMLKKAGALIAAEIDRLTGAGRMPPSAA